MPYHFVPPEPVHDALKRIASEELVAAVGLLQEPHGGGRNERVHEARKSLKKARALLRLGRFALPSETFRSENATFRDSARLLSEARAAAASLECFDHLVSDPDFGLAADAIATARIRLAGECSADPGTTHSPDEQAAAALEAALPRVQNWHSRGDDWTALGPGLEAVYSRGRKAMSRAFSQGSVGAYHAWRKEAKYLWYSMRLLEPCWPRALRALSTELDALGEALGQDHDLADLEDRLRRSGIAEPDEMALALQELIHARRHSLRDAARRAGVRVYVESPRAFATRIGTYFDIWRDETRSEGRVALE